MILRAYLKAWAWEVGRFFDGLAADSPDADVAAAAPGFPVFAITDAARPAADELTHWRA